MRSLLCVVVLLALVVAAVPAFAGDIVAMPTGNMCPKDQFQFNYIYWDLDAGPLGLAPKKAQIYEGFYGVNDWLEADVLVADVDKQGTDTELNLYADVVKETATHPSFIVGATNVTASKFLGNDQVSPFFLSSYNIHVPVNGRPSLNDPLVRIHAAWGANFHGETWFGGIQMMLSPYLGVGAFSYQHQPSYMAALRVSKTLELRAGWKSGTPFYSGGLYYNF